MRGFKPFPCCKGSAAVNLTRKKGLEVSDPAKVFNMREEVLLLEHVGEFVPKQPGGVQLALKCIDALLIPRTKVQAGRRQKDLPRRGCR